MKRSLSLGVLLDERRQVEERAVRGVLEPKRALGIDDVGRRAGHELRLVEDRHLRSLLVEPFDLDARMLLLKRLIQPR